MRSTPLMAALLALACAAPPAWEQPPPEIRTGAVVDAARLTRAELPNGMQILVFEDPRLPRASLGVQLRRGAAVEENGEAGLATYTAQLLERGAGERDALELADSVGALGASLEAAAGWDSMSVEVSGLSRDLDALFAVLADVVLRPRFDPAEAERVRDEHVAGLHKSRDDPGTLARNQFASAVYGDHRYGLPAAGLPETVSRLGAAEAQAFHAEVFTPANAILFATGDVTAADVIARAELAFGTWTGGPVPPPAPEPALPAPPERRIVIVDRPDLGQAQIMIGHDGIARAEPERIPISLMNRVLGDSGFNSRLMGRVRGDEGLTYGIYSYFSTRRRPGPFAVSVATRVPKAGEVVGIVLEEMGGMAEQPLSEEELRRVKGLSTSAFVLGLETPGAVTGALVDLAVHDLPDDSLDTYRERVAAVELEEVRRAAGRLAPGRAAIVVVGPAEALRPQLEGLGPVEVVTP